MRDEKWLLSRMPNWTDGYDCLGELCLEGLEESQCSVQRVPQPISNVFSVYVCGGVGWGGRRVLGVVGQSIGTTIYYS